MGSTYLELPLRSVGSISAPGIASETTLQAVLVEAEKTLQIKIDGVDTDVEVDTVTPGNSVRIPVEVYSASGPINITAGDINMQLSDSGTNPDIVKIGDGVNRLEITANKEIKSHDADTLAELVTLNAVDFATEAKQDAIVTALGLMATQTTLAALLTELQLKADLSETQPVSLASSPLPTGAATETTLAANGVLIGVVSETAPASDTASSGLNGRLQRIAQNISSLITHLAFGIKTAANSLSITPASDAVFSTKPKAVTTSFAEKLTLTTVDTFTAPANAIGGKIYAKKGNPGDVIFKQGGVATVTSGIFMEGGRAEDFFNGSDISVISESGTNAVSVIWNIQA